MAGVWDAQGLTLADVRGVLREFLATIGDESAAAEAERERSRVRRLLAALGQEEDEAAAEAAAAEPAAAVQPSPEGKHPFLPPLIHWLCLPRTSWPPSASLLLCVCTFVMPTPQGRRPFVSCDRDGLSVF